MSMEELLMSYIRADLMILVAALFFLGELMKRSTIVKDEVIPYILWVFGIILTGIYLFAKTPIESYQTILSTVFEVLIQGTFCTAGAVFFDQLLKQYDKLKSTK